MVFRGTEEGSVVANRVQKRDYRKLTVNEGGGIISIVKSHKGEGVIRYILSTKLKSTDPPLPSINNNRSLS